MNASSVAKDSLVIVWLLNVILV